MNQTNPQKSDAYQHWLDDAANMGLMLYRMRQDSKRERILRGGHHHHASSKPVPLPPPLPVPIPIPIEAPKPTIDPTPRTSAALQIPTVATQSTSSPPLPELRRPHPLHIPLD